MTRWAIRRSLRSCWSMYLSSRTQSPTPPTRLWAAGWTPHWGEASCTWTSSSLKGLGRRSWRRSCSLCRVRGPCSPQICMSSLADLGSKCHAGSRSCLPVSYPRGPTASCGTIFSWSITECQSLVAPWEHTGGSSMQNVRMSSTLAAHLCGQGPSS